MAGLEKSSWSRALRIRNQTVREMLSEMLGTFVLTLFSVAAGAQYTLSHQQNASFLALNVANGFGVTLAIYSCGGVSGGCVNPAISLTMCLTGRLPWKRYPFHVIGQICGAFIAACLVYGVYHEAIDMYDGGNRYVTGKEATAGIFCFFPQDYLSAEGGFLDSIVGTGMLVLSSLAVIDTRNMNPSPGFSAFPVGVAVMVIGNTFGMNSGYPINPARDLGPRIFITIAGWGREAFSYRDYNWFWVPLLGPLAGAILFTLIYTLVISLHWPEEAELTDLQLEISDANGEKSSHRNGNVADSTTSVATIGFYDNSHDNKGFVSDSGNAATQF